MKFVGGRDKIAVPADLSVETSVGIGPIPTGFGIRLSTKSRCQAWTAAEKLVDAAHIVCPYSNATRGNIDVTLTIV
jgi:organic hydroperoxide reductase OsmC/OhrA